MRIIFTWQELIVMNGITEIARYPASCDVRTELNGRRAKDEVVYTIPKKGMPKPYYPRQFASGIFEITGIEETNDPTYAPIKIKTTATRKVFTWDLDTKGNYWEPTGLTQEDTAYWIHYTDSSTTLGCIRIGSAKDIRHLANIIRPTLAYGDTLYLEVL
jgi:hypothetical protein